MNPLKAERAKPSLSSDYNLLFKNKIGESSLDIHRGPKNHEETLEHAKEITSTFKSQKTPIRACFTNESTLYAQAA